MHPLQPVTATTYKSNILQNKFISHRKLPSNMAEENVEQPAPDSMTISAVLDTSLEEHLRTFTLFPKLPTELRLKIWKLSAQQVRVVKWVYGISRRTTFINKAGVPQDKYYFKNLSTDALPSILHATRESRGEALRTYTLCLESHFRNPIHFNYERDIFVFEHGHGPFKLTRLGPTLPNHADLLASFQRNLRYLVVAGRHSLGRLELHNLRDFRNLKLLVLPHTRSASFATTELNTYPPRERRQWYENAVRAKLQEYWNSPPTIQYHRSSSGPIYLEECKKIMDAQQVVEEELEQELQSWWGEIDRAFKSGRVIDAPSNMATEVIFLNDQEIEALVEKALGHPLPWTLFKHSPLHSRDADS
jgi:hypothetical protein